jgi:dTDP-4-dehydrorhamnose reductase
MVLGLRHADIDICEEDAVSWAIEHYAPRVLINAAAYTAVDRAESETQEAFHVNQEGAHVVAKLASRADLPLIHLSTDYVFDGRSRIPYAETEPVNPLSVYGHSKEAGERVVRETCPRYILLRTSWLFGPFGNNFLRTMLLLAPQRAEIAVVSDQLGCPTSAADVASAILVIAEAIDCEKCDKWGTYHYAGADAVTWYDFAAMIFASTKQLGGTAPKLRPISSSEYAAPATRPTYSVLNTDKLRGTFGITPRRLTESLADCLQRFEFSGDRSSQKTRGAG